jgi:hypothetical protein
MRGGVLLALERGAAGQRPAAARLRPPVACRLPAAAAARRECSQRSGRPRRAPWRRPRTRLSPAGACRPAPRAAAAWPAPGPPAGRGWGVAGGAAGGAHGGSCCRAGGAHTATHTRPHAHAHAHTHPPSHTHTHPRHVRVLVLRPVHEVPAAVVVALQGGDGHGGVAARQQRAGDACDGVGCGVGAWVGGLVARGRVQRCPASANTRLGPAGGRPAWRAQPCTCTLQAPTPCTLHPPPTHLLGQAQAGAAVEGLGEEVAGGVGAAVEQQRHAARLLGRLPRNLHAVDGLQQRGRAAGGRWARALQAQRRRLAARPASLAAQERAPLLPPPAAPPACRPA